MECSLYRECIHMVLDRPLASEPELPRFDAIKRPPTEAKCTSFAPQKLPLAIKCNNMSEKCCVYARNRPNNHLGFSARYTAIYHVLPPTTTRRTTDKPHSTQTNHVRPTSIQGLCQISFDASFGIDDPFRVPTRGTRRRERSQ